ncbi:lipopolysaccharide biosynthesis protein [Raoultella planticola]|uniref:lipopolysaccharide biosynthesis protein n=1 Tax=Raoultella planticola TaxID=575 RepID=UPI0034E4382E
MSLLSNAKWNAFSQFFKIGIQVVNLVYLAKIIPPAEYGIMAMAVVITNFGILLRDLGTSAAIIQKKELNENIKNTIFWLNVILGFSLGIIIIAISPLIANTYEQPELTRVLLFLSIIFPLSSSAATHLALMERESKFKTISIIEVTSSLTSVVFAVVFANLGYGVYSLVIQSVILNLMSAAQFWLASKWRPSFKVFIHISVIKEIFGFSANLSLFNLINYFSRNTDSFIIGKYMSAAILGSYNLAYRIMLFPLQSLTFVASRSLYPILSQQQDSDTEIKDIYYNCIFFILLITMPLMSGIAIYSYPFVSLVFGSQWNITAEVLQWLAPTAIIQSVLSTTGAVFMAKGRTDILMRLGIVGTVLQVSAFIIGAQFSITIFSFCYLIANILNFFPVMYCLLNIISGSFLSFFKKISPIVFSSLIMILALKLIDFYIIPSGDVQSILMLTLLSTIGASIYACSLLLFSVEVRMVIIRRVK